MQYFVLLYIGQFKFISMTDLNKTTSMGANIIEQFFFSFISTWFLHIESSAYVLTRVSF